MVRFGAADGGPVNRRADDADLEAPCTKCFVARGRTDVVLDRKLFGAGRHVGSDRSWRGPNSSSPDAHVVVRVGYPPYTSWEFPDAAHVLFG